MIDRNLNDVTFSERLVMGTRMEMMLTSGRLQIFGNTVLKHMMTAAGYLFSGDPYGIAALADGSGAQVLYQPPETDQEHPLDD